MDPFSFARRIVVRHRPRALVALAAVATLATGACERGAVDPGSSVVRARISGISLEITNTSDEALAYLAAEQRWLALANWAQCAQPDPTCLRLPAGGTVTVPLASVSGYEPGATIVVHYWDVQPMMPGRFRSGPIRYVLVRE